MKQILIATALFAATFLASNNIFAKEVIAVGHISLQLKKFDCSESPEGPVCSCPPSPESDCVVTTTVYDDMTIDVFVGQARLTDPGPLTGDAQDMAVQIANRLEVGEVFGCEPLEP